VEEGTSAHSTSCEGEAETERGQTEMDEGRGLVTKTDRLRESSDGRSRREGGGKEINVELFLQKRDERERERVNERAMPRQIL
jgi:hypothetical protein